MLLPSTITIDGFAASGKSTVAALLAETLDYLYFDTGIMYRAVTWAVLNRNVDPTDVEAVSELSENITIEATPGGPDDGRQNTIYVDGQDVTWLIRQLEVETHVSLTASYPRVRQALTAQQRRMAANRPIVMVGRDIGTVVLPDADLKIFMQASAEERARRRYKEALLKDESANYVQILKAIIARDERDKCNPISPTVPAQDAIVVNTDGISIEDVVDQLKQLVVRHKNGAR